MSDHHTGRFFQRHGGGVLRTAFQKAHDAEKAVGLHLVQQTLGGLVVVHVQSHLPPQHVKDGRYIVALLVNDFALFEDFFSGFRMVGCHSYRRLSAIE